MNGVKENRGVLSITDFTKRQPPFFIRTFGKSFIPWYTLSRKELFSEDFRFPLV